ncbi:septal ring lytic transglycosylase RlpA family protein [Hydrogenophaga pseudoflava]|uniref:septal ring lytic transglycosylase RlpA family protein n=1 Tax=Hydrogenophaga pseudoflava TaxID=47421 RepID=UPI0027E40376|nr:septal ring lytic transglycosylase RlpA family protein [Hydrogenophaga pseudoflava]MDQ7743714.1 septal ring lytic transglycosylase RlpA family protein [Hydrogenophaga pseudoflava]
MVVWAGCAAPPIPSGPEDARAVRSPAAASVAPAVPAAGIGRAAAEPAAPATTEPAAAGTRDPVQAGDAANALERGLASWYGRRFHGRRTASGERYDRHAMTAAHRTLPFGTRVRVRSVVTGMEVVVRINDRGPFKRSRVIDLSQAAFHALGLQGRGVAQVELLPE